MISAISLSTLSVLPHRVGLRQLSSTPKLMMPLVIGKPLCTSSRIVTVLACYLFAARLPKNVVFASSARDERATRQTHLRTALSEPPEQVRAAGEALATCRSLSRKLSLCRASLHPPYRTSNYSLVNAMPTPRLDWQQHYGAAALAMWRR